MKLNRRGILGLSAVALAVAAGGTAFAATSQVSAVPVTAVTHEVNLEDTGHGTPPGWAYKDIDRALTVTPDGNLADCATLAGWNSALDSCYTATISDSGTFSTIFDAKTPNQSVPGQQIAHVVHGTVTGTYSYVLYAPTADTFSAATVPANFNAGDTKPLPPALTSNDLWPAQEFENSANVIGFGVVVKGGAYSWTYTTPAGESWTDSSTNGDGNLVQDGNITGLLAPPPVIIRLSRGHGTATAPNRETVSYQQSGAASWDAFYIVGPGAINGHRGWVNAQVGLNFGYYEGLEAGHGYTVYYTPVEGQGSSVQVPGSRAGYVYFVS